MLKGPIWEISHPVLIAIYFVVCVVTVILFRKIVG
jgi:hypothetical protein